jgi:hypothetical protein
MVLLFAVLLRVGAFGQGQTFYVDNAQGSDSNSGSTPELAWKTLTKVNATIFHPGDQVLLKSGETWNGHLAPLGSGDVAHPILLGKFGGEALPRVDTAGSSEAALSLRNQQYWEVRDLELTNHGEAAGVRSGARIVSENGGELHHIYIASLVVHDVNGSDASKRNGGIIYESIGNNVASRFVDLRIENNRVYHVDRDGISGWSTHWVRTAWFPSLGVIVRGNTLEDIGGDGIMVSATDGALIEHNVVGHANQRSEGYNVAIWPWSADNTIVQYNEAFGTKGQRDGEGFDSDWNSRGTVIQYNYSHDNEGGFLLICNEGGHGTDSVGNIGTVVRYNISQNDHHRGINIAGPVQDVQIYNNTIYTGKNESVPVVLFSDWGGWADSVQLKNNIFYAARTASIARALSRKPNGEHVSAPGVGSSTHILFDSNIYFGMSQPPADAHGLTGDPRLMDPGSGQNGFSTLGGYRLQANSPAIDSGATIQATMDFFGTPVPICKGVDRGAVESAVCGSR